jgi:hypothetical protein
LRQTAPGVPAAAGPGDLTLGAQWCVVRNGWLKLDAALQYFAKLPTASASKGLGDGQVDQTLMVLLSRDFGPLHADLNLLETWLGREGASAERQPAATLSVSRALSERWSITAKLYGIGATSANPKIVSNLWSVGYKLSPRFVLSTPASTSDGRTAHSGSRCSAGSRPG